MRPIATAIILLTFSLAVGDLRADGIADVRSALEKFSGRESIRLRVSQSLTTSSDEDDSKPESGQAALTIQAGPEGVSMAYPASELARVEKEERANQRNPESPTGTAGALSEISPVQAWEFANLAPKLLHMLERATLVSESRQTFQGKSMRMLTLSIAPALSAAQKKHVRDIDHTLTLRLREDQVPIAAESSFTVKARFLLIRVEHNTKESWTLQPHGTRLVVTRHVEESGGSAMGRGYRKKGTATISVQ